MERALKTSATIKPRPGQDVFLLPGSSEAEPWGVWIADAHGGSQLALTCASPQDNPWQKRSALLLPVAHVFCLPLWLNETQADLLRGMIDLQLEARGLAGRGDKPAIYQWTAAAREGSRTLALVGLLPADLPAAFQLSAYRAFDVSARYFAWPENAMTLWLEQGRLAVAFTRGANLVYFQSLGEPRGSERVVQTLVCLRASLELQEIIPDLSQIVLWTDMTPSEITGLEGTLKLPVRSVEAPSPRAPASAWNLSPHEVVRSRKEIDSRRWKWRGLLIAAVVYLLIAAFLIGQLLLTSHRVAGLREWQDAHAADVAAVQQAQANWQRLQPVTDTGNYPLEVLLHCAESIPKDQLHLTLFEYDGDKLLLRGEATNVGAAFTLLDRLKNEPKLSAYTWTMEEPHLLPNDLAQLQIEGTHAIAHF